MSSSTDVLYRLAESRSGYFTTAQANADGVSRQQLSYLARTGVIERVAHGIYRLRRFPAQRFEDVAVACLWAGRDAVASHGTALAVYRLTDEMPARIHVTVPTPFRGMRKGVVVHVAPISADERTQRDGVPVTTVERTVSDIARSAGPAPAVTAALEAISRGLTSSRRIIVVLEGQPDAVKAVRAATAKLRS